MNPALYLEVSHFLYHEAFLLDSRKYEEWLKLLADDIVYRMPIRVTTERNTGTDLVDEMTYYEESKKSLTTRVKRLYTNSAWVENPAPRQRHFISNVVIGEGASADELKVRSYFHFKRSRGSDIESEEMFGYRDDTLRKENGDWKIAARTIYPDQAVITTMNMSMFL